VTAPVVQLAAWPLRPQRYEQSLTTAKVALSIPTDALKQAKKQVSSGRAKSLSFYVSETLRRDELADVLDAMVRDLGEPRRADVAWAKRVLKPSS